MTRPPGDAGHIVHLTILAHLDDGSGETEDNAALADELCPLIVDALTAAGLLLTRDQT